MLDEWKDRLSDEDEAEEISEQYRNSLAIEQAEALAIELEQDERRRAATPDEPSAKKKLKRELEQKALARLESSARTVSDWQNVVSWWDRLDANRERRERYHEVSRSGDELPIDYGAEEDGLRFPNTMNSIIDRQIQKGDFIDAIFDCPFDIHELVTEPYLSRALYELSDEHKEILYFSAVRLYSTLIIGKLRGQSDRNIRKVRKTMLKRIHKRILPYLKEREEMGLSMTMEERAFLAEMRKKS